MKTAEQIKSEYRMSNYQLNDCADFYKEMHENGHHSIVQDFLLRGEKNTITYDITLRALTNRVDTPFKDDRGAYAGTHSEYLYRGQKVHNCTSWSLFN